MPGNPGRDRIHIGAVTARITARAGRPGGARINSGGLRINSQSLNSREDTLTETAHRGEQCRSLRTTAAASMSTTE